MVIAFAGLLFLELNRKGSIQVASVALVGIDVHLEFGMLVFSHQQIFEHDRTLMRLDAQGHEITIDNAVKRRIAWSHVNMASSPNYSLG